MAASIKTFGLVVRNSPALNGGLSIQPVRPSSGLGGGGIGGLPGSGGSRGAPGTPSAGSGAPGVSGVVQGVISERGALDAISAGGLGRPIDAVPAVAFEPPIAHLIKDKYPIDSLTVAQTRLMNGQFKPIMDGGITPFRPEILSIIDFSPIYGLGDRLRNSPVGDFIDVQYQASHLREGTLLKLVDKIQRLSRTTTSDDAFRTVRTNFTAELTRVGDQISHMQDVLTNVNNVKNSLEIKKIPSTFYNQTNFLSPEDFFVKRMSYRRNQYASFSDTKILLQLLFDFRSILEGYSISLLDLQDSDRVSDISPISIDKSYTQSNGFSFSLGNLRSVTSPVNATESGFFNQFMSSLPQDPDDRIRILTTILGKEYLVSRGLGRQDLQRLLQSLKISTTGNPFDNVIGEVGGTIFETPRGDRSLASLMHVDPGIPNATVLPFESKYVDTEDQKFVYVPGSSYFIDSILSTTGNNWNTGPYVNFINLYNSRIKEARNVIEEFLSLNDLSILLSPGTLSDACMVSVKSAINTLTEPSAVSGDQAVITALFRLASTDADLKGMLFQFSILVGMAMNGETEQKEIFDLLGRSEISSLRKLSYLQIPTGVEPNPSRGQAVIKPYIEQLADAIETKVVSLTSKSLADYSRFLATNDLMQRLRPFRSSWLTTSVASAPLRSNLLGNVSLTTGTSAKKEQSVTVHIQRGNIARILKNITASGGDNKTNFIEEFVSVATNLFKASQSQGANVHLLQDSTGRTRYNFLSLSTQLLMLFEIFSSYANRYAFASFEKTMFETESLISVDTTGCAVTVASIEELTKKSIFTNFRDLITTTMSPGLDTLRNAYGGSGAPGTTTIQGTRISPPSVGVPAGLSNTQTRRMVGTSDGALNGSNLKFSSTLLTSISSDLAKALKTTPLAEERLTSGLSNLGAIRNVTDVHGNIEQLRNLITNADNYIGYKVSLGSTRRKIYDEFNIVGNCLHILSAVGKFMQNGADKVRTAFTQTSLQAFIRENGDYGLQMLKNSSQSRLAAATLQNIKDKAPASDYSPETGYVYNGLVNSDTVTLQEYRCLRALLASGVYLNSSGLSASANNRVKILSVGVPAGFSTQLADRVNVGEITAKTFRDKEFDVISVNVYKRDARFDDIVFKPQKFLFDMSLFVLEKDVNDILPAPDEAFLRMMERAKITDYTNLKLPRKLNVSSIKEDERYDFLQGHERVGLLHSHFASYLLGIYLNLITGMRISEDSFLQGLEPQYRNLNLQMQQIVLSYLKDVMRQNIPTGQTISNLLQNPSISEDAKDVLRLFDYGSLVFNEKEVSNRVLTPKLFDRIFHIPLNIEAFEIDVEKTLSTEAGRRSWAQSYLQNKLEIIGGRYWLKERLKNELIFEDYFVAIETANDKEPT